MQRKIIIIAILVIVLVSLNWFKVLVAQDLGSLSSRQKEQLRLKCEQTARPQTGSPYYQTPSMFDAAERECDATFSKAPDSDGADLDVTAPGNSGSAVSELGSLTELPEFDELKPFGAEFFAVRANADIGRDVAATDDYVLGPGDQLIISLWGRVEKQYDLTIDREGKLFIPTVGQLTAWGVSLEDFTHQARKAFGRVYSDFDLTCSLGKIRSIRIYITGEVKNPGAYTVTSLTSLFNALTLAGGPSEQGSMRRIKLMRAGECRTQVDLYQLLLAGDNTIDSRLLSGDVIFVPVASAQVAVRGQVKRSALYELMGDETALDVLALAGNPTAEAYLKRVMLERIAGRDEWEVVDLDLDPGSGDGIDNISLVDGDRLTVFTIYEAKRNLVGLFGQVKHPGYYERTDTTHISHLLAQAQLQAHNVYYDRADLFRHHPDSRVEIIPLNLRAIINGEADMVVADRDSIHIYPIDQLRRQRRVYVEGAVKNPGWYPLYTGMTVADLVFLAGSFERQADLGQAELASISDDGEVSLRYVSPSDQTAGQIHLAEDDHLFVRSIPGWQSERAVTIEGQVRYPGEYVLASDRETLYELLSRTGGFTSNAFPLGIILERSSIEGALRHRGVSDMLERSKPLATDSLGNVTKGEIFEYDLGSMNRIILDVDNILATSGAQGDVVLQPGDHIIVPSVPTGVPVMGAVGSNGTLSFVEGQKVKRYIQRAGNFTRQADKKQTRLIRADGEVFSGGSVLGKQALLGDIIIVPTRIERDRDWGRTITTAVSAVTGLLTSIYIVSRL
ncbi:MAG: SLBB domain-containing protein [bacterium]